MLMITLEDLIKLLVAVIIGSVIGFEREVHSKAAGLRTITLITVGATIFTVLSTRFGSGDPARVAANIVVGMGFLGAGTILSTGGKVKGLTTASSMWVAAALGLAIGIGEYALAGATTIVVVTVLALFARFDRWLDIKGRETRMYEVVHPARDGKFEELDALFRECHLRVRSRKKFKQGKMLVSHWDADGRTADHNCLVERLLADEEVKELRH